MTDAELERLFVLDTAAGPALPIDAARADAIIDAALAGAGFGPGGGGGGSASGATGTGVAAGTKLAILGGAVLIAIAIALLIGRTPHRAPQVAVVIPDAALPDAAEQGSGSAAQPSPPPAVEPTVEEPATIEMPPDRATPPRDKQSAADLLGEANAKRAEKKWRESDALYEKVVQRAPKSLAAQTALVASAALRLEHLGDPKGAAQRFRRALAIAPSGALAEDARWGLAEAARASHDDKAEAAALDAFLAHHPDSPLAARAKARRAELP
jgi:tetratricopeptide (TPR) repeat protein